MDWTQQMEEMGKQWTDVQKKLWLNWSEAAQQASTNVQAKAMWQQMLDTWKNAVYRMLDLQVESARLWSESVAASETMESTVQWAEQFYRMTKQSSTVQKQLWDGWFQMAERLDPMQMQNMMDMSAQPLNLWKEMSQQAMTMQKEWMKTWSAWQPGKGK
jgi:hypothetical protein